jgi:hypothetical protein
MTIKDLFTKSKIAIYESAESASANIESADFLQTKIQENNTFIPFLDFSDPSVFIKFGSAELYYQNSIKRVYQQYPYDGSGKEKITYQLSSSYLDRWLYDNKYPKSTGYGIFTATSYGSSTITDGYGLPVAASREYIYAAGGLHTASDGMQSGELFKNFDDSIIYDANKNRTQNFRVNPVDGTTIEFWLNKSAFITGSTKKEVILDLWNGELSSSATYGRLTIYLTGSTSGNSPVRATMQNGTTGFSDQSLAASTFTTASVADGNWHHYAVSFLSQSSGMKSYFYVDGDLNNEQTIGSAGMSEFSGRMNAYIGALQTSPSGSAAAQYAGKLSASLDEFRFWKKRRTSQKINLHWYRPVEGGANTEDNNTSLGCYFKFNEGITGNATTDSVVLDYSGRLANGTWGGYAAGARNIGSCFVSASVLSKEPADPIIYSTHPSVVSLQSEMAASGSDYDQLNTTFLYDKLPQFMRDQDEDNEEDIKKLFQIISSYFDTIYAQTKVVPLLTNKNYISSSTKPLPFSNRLLESRGFVTSELFVDTDILEFYGDNDFENKKYVDNVNDIKNLIYHNIYNNLDYIYKTKGSEKSFRNLLRCFGIDDELVKFNVYTDGGTHYFNDNFKNSSVTAKFINNNNPNYFHGSVYQTASANNSKSYISGSAGEKLEKNNAFTFEVDAIIPDKIPPTDPAFFDTTFLSSSIGGFHQATGAGFEWATGEIANAQMYLVRDEIGSNRAKFVLENQDNTLYLTSSYYDEIYDNNRWVLAVRVKPAEYPIVGSYLSSSNPNYEISFYGVNHQFGQVRDNFNSTATLNYASGSSYLSQPKRVYVGAHRQNFTGSVLQESDVEIGSCRFWLDYLDGSDLSAHSKDITNFGVDNSVRNGTIFARELLNVPIPRADTLALHWDFDLVTSSSAGGSFDVVDISSGSNDTIYGWVDNIIRREHKGKGIGYGSSVTTFVDKELVYTSKKELPEISVTADGVKVKTDTDKFFIKDDDVSDNFYSLEKSMYQIISEEMLAMFASAKEFNNLIGLAEDRYRHKYKNLDKMRQLFFSKVEADMDFDRFTNYYKWIDSAISEMMAQLYPASARHSDSIADMVESHILERNKFQNKFPLTTRLESTEGRIRGVSELDYNWKFGHAPLTAAAIGTLVFSSNPTNGQTVTISDGVTAVTFTFVSSPTGAANEVEIESTAAVAADNLEGVINANAFNVVVLSNDNLGTITLINTNRDAAETGNVAITTTTSATISGMSGGSSNDNRNCRWQKERRERTDIADRETIRKTINNRNNAIAPLLFKDDGTSYQGSTYAINKLSKPYKESIGFSNPIHGGTNYNEGKDRDFVYNATHIHGPVSAAPLRGIPQNVFAVGLGEGQGADAFIDCIDVEDPNEKRKWRFSAVVGRDATGLVPVARTGKDYEFKVKSSIYWPSNLVSGTVDTGYNKRFVETFKSGTIITNLHSDTYSPSNDIGMQSPFTEAWVGGRQSRHVDLNRHDTTLKTQGGDATLNSLDDQYSRPEGWRLLLRECDDASLQGNSEVIGSISGSSDGAMGFVGPDYGGPYPDPNRRYAIRYRDERAKRPINVKNIQTTTASAVIGNYTRNYEVIHSFGRKINDKKFVEATKPILPSFFDGLEATTQEASLVGTNAFANAVAILTLPTKATANDTLTIGDGVGSTKVLTYKASATSPNHIAVGADAAATRANTKAKLEGAFFDFSVEAVGNTLVITNNQKIDQSSQVTIQETYTAADNVVSQQFVGAFVSNGNLVSNFNNSGRYPEAVKTQAAYDPNTGFKTIVATRFSAPGSAETMSEIFLDVPSKEFSAYNALPFRNLSVRGSGSGESGTIRVNSQANRREGLETLLRRHCGRFGIDSNHGVVSSGDYIAEASFIKINRNTKVVPRGDSQVIDEIFDNGFVVRDIPSQDYGYSWVTASLGDELSVRRAEQQIAFGRWPTDGILSASANLTWRSNGFDSAVNFPSGSNIYGIEV